MSMSTVVKVRKRLYFTGGEAAGKALLRMAIGNGPQRADETDR